MARKIVGFFSTRQQAESTEQQLLEAGFARDQIGIYSGKDGAEPTGLWEEIKEIFGFAGEADRQLYHEATRRGAVAVWVTLSDTDAAPRQTLATQILEKSKPVDLDAQSKQWRTEGWSGAAGAVPITNKAASTARAPVATNQGAESGRTVVPVIEEELQVGKRVVQGGGIHVFSRTTEKPVEEQVQLREEHVNVERRPVNRPVTDADKAFQNRSVEVTAVSEQAVVSKQARVVEEVVVNKDVSQRTETVRDKVRRSDVQVEQSDTQPGQEGVADRFAQELATNAQYRGRDWQTIEPDARRTFERTYPGSAWEKVKDAVRRDYDRLRQKV